MCLNTESKLSVKLLLWPLRLGKQAKGRRGVWGERCWVLTVLTVACISTNLLRWTLLCHYRFRRVLFFISLFFISFQKSPSRYQKRKECAATSLRAQIFPGELFFACFSTLVYYSHFGLFPVSTTAESNCNQFAVRGEGVVQCESCIHGQINTCFGVYACMASQKRISLD